MSREAVDVDLSGFGVRFEGLPHELAAELRTRWSEYLAERVESPEIVIRVEDDLRAMAPGRFMDGSLRIEATRESIRFGADEGELVHDRLGTIATVRLARGDDGRRFWGLVNLACAAVGWRLAARGGGAVHAAGVLIDRRAFLVVGPPGCGKTTWARTASQAGLPVLSDDCVLLDASTGRLSALGSPFRSSDFPSPGRGRWPVAAILIPRWAAEPSLAPTTRLMLEARIASSLLFTDLTHDSHSAAARAVAAIAAGAPARILSFRPDASWVPLVGSLR